MANKKNDSTILWFIGLFLFIIIAPKLPFLHGNFAVQTQTICSSNVVSNWEFENNILDINGLNNGINNGAVFVSGKFGNAVSFNGTNFINFPSLSGDYSAWISTSNSSFSFVANINGTNYVNTIQSTSIIIPNINSTFGKGTTYTIDDLTYYSSLPYSEMISIYNNGTGNAVCYEKQTIVNESCVDYAKNYMTDNPSNSLQISGDFYPNCTFNWNTAQYSISNNQCVRNFLYISSCTPSVNCYSLSDCTNQLTTNANAQATQTATSTPFNLNMSLFNLFGFNITPLYLIIAFIVVIGLIFLLGGKK